MASLGVNCFPASSTDKADTSTIVPRTRIDRRDDESGRCNGSNRPNKRKTSSPLIRSSTATSVHVDINLQLKLSRDPVGCFQNLAPGDMRTASSMAGAAAAILGAT